jgi:hypothetical protein
MARAQRFTVKLEFFTTEQQFAALEALEASTMLTKSDHLRQAMNLYLRQLGMMPSRPVANGQMAHPAPQQ